MKPVISDEIRMDTEQEGGQIDSESNDGKDSIAVPPPLLRLSPSHLPDDTVDIFEGYSFHSDMLGDEPEKDMGEPEDSETAEIVAPSDEPNILRPRPTALPLSAHLMQRIPHSPEYGPPTTDAGSEPASTTDTAPQVREDILTLTTEYCDGHTSTQTISDVTEEVSAGFDVDFQAPGGERRGQQSNYLCTRHEKLRVPVLDLGVSDTDTDSGDDDDDANEGHDNEDGNCRWSVDNENDNGPSLLKTASQ